MLPLAPPPLLLLLLPRIAGRVSARNAIAVGVVLELQP